MRWPGSQEKLFQASRRADVHSPVEPSLRGIVYSWPSPDICELCGGVGVSLKLVVRARFNFDIPCVGPAGPSKSSRQTRARPGTSGAMMAEGIGVFLDGFQMMRGDWGIPLCPEDKNYQKVKRISHQ